MPYLGRLTDEEKRRANLLAKTKPIAAMKCSQYDKMLVAGKSIALIQLQYSYRCNMSCSHCSVAGFRRKKFNRCLDIPTVKRIFDEAHAYGLAHMGISGGEPLTFPDFDNLVDAIGPERFHIQLDTNGFLFDSATAKRVKSMGIDKVQISIDGLDAKEHDAFRRKPGSHYRCMTAIDAVLDAGLALQVATVVNHQRAQSQELEEFMKLMHSKCAPISVIYAKPVGEYASRLDLMCTPADIRGVKQLMAQYGGYDHSSPGYGRDIGCTAVKRIISVTAFGEVLPCPWMYWTLGNVYEMPLEDILAKGMRYFGKRCPVCRLSESPEFVRDYASKAVWFDELPTVEEVMGELTNEET
jgi:MoaA/NifB/PqqE/SkfB family radical SAM enzyme